MSNNKTPPVAFVSVGNTEPPEARLSEAEKQVLAALQETLGGRATDELLIRFLRSWKCMFEEDKWISGVAEVVEGVLEWRRQLNLDGITERDLPREEEFRSNWNDFCHGSDAYGRPVHYNCIGGIDPGKLMSSFTAEEVVLFHCKSNERVREACEAIANQNGYEAICSIEVLDLKGMGLAHLRPKFLSLVKEVIGVDDNRYSGLSCKLVIVNAPKIFSGGWNVIKPMLHKETQDKIFISSNKTVENLAKVGVDVTDLPEAYRR